MKTKSIFQYVGVVLLAVLIFFVGFYCGRDDYQSEL